MTEDDSVTVEYALMVAEYGLVVAEYGLIRVEHVVFDYDAHEYVECEHDCAHVVHSTIAIKVQLTDEIWSA